MTLPPWSHLRKGDVVGDDLAHLGEMPSEPFSQSHGVVVQLFVEVIEQGYRLNDHRVHFVGGELQFVSG